MSGGGSGPFALVDMDHHALAVDVGDFKVLGFLESEATGVDGGEEDVVLKGVHTGKDALDLLDVKH